MTAVEVADYSSLRLLNFPFPSLVKRPTISDKHTKTKKGVTNKNPRSFLFRLSFLITFLCIFRLAAASGFVVAWRTRAVFLSLRSPSTLCRIWLYTFANLVVPTLDCTRSCSSTAVVFSSSINFVSDNPLIGSWKKKTLPICESRIVSSSVNLYTGVRMWTRNCSNLAGSMCEAMQANQRSPARGCWDQLS